jgi:hypothetical protein
VVPHGYQWAEVAPAAPLIWEALAPFITICLVGFAFAWVWLNRQLVMAVGGFISRLVSHVPFVGGGAASLVRDLEKAIIGPLANAETYLDNRMGTAWHKLARVYDRIAGDLERLAHVSLLLALAVTGGLSAKQREQLDALIVHYFHDAVHAIGGVLHTTVVHTKVVYTTVVHDVIPKVGHLTHSVYVDVAREIERIRTRERQIAHEVDVTIPRDIARLRDETRAIEDHAIGLFRWLRAHPSAAASTAFAGAVAIALTKLGLGWLRCNSARSFFRKAGCGFWRLLEDALALIATLALAAYSVLRPQDLARAAVDAVDVVEPILAEILRN